MPSHYDDLLKEQQARERRGAPRQQPTGLHQRGMELGQGTGRPAVQAVEISVPPPRRTHLDVTREGKRKLYEGQLAERGDPRFQTRGLRQAGVPELALESPPGRAAVAVPTGQPPLNPEAAGIGDQAHARERVLARPIGNAPGANPSVVNQGSNPFANVTNNPAHVQQLTKLQKLLTAENFGYDAATKRNKKLSPQARNLIKQLRMAGVADPVTAVRGATSANLDADPARNVTEARKDARGRRIDASRINAGSTPQGTTSFVEPPDFNQTQQRGLRSRIDPATVTSFDVAVNKMEPQARAAMQQKIVQLEAEGARLSQEARQILGLREGQPFAPEMAENLDPRTKARYDALKSRFDGLRASTQNIMLETAFPESAPSTVVEQVADEARTRGNQATDAANEAAARAKEAAPEVARETGRIVSETATAGVEGAQEGARGRGAAEVPVGEASVEEVKASRASEAINKGAEKVKATAGTLTARAADAFDVLTGKPPRSQAGAEKPKTSRTSMSQLRATGRVGKTAVKTFGRVALPVALADLTNIIGDAEAKMELDRRNGKENIDPDVYYWESALDYGGDLILGIREAYKSGADFANQVPAVRELAGAGNVVAQMVIGFPHFVQSAGQGLYDVGAGFTDTVEQAFDSSIHAGKANSLIQQATSLRDNRDQLDPSAPGYDEQVAAANEQIATLREQASSIIDKRQEEGFVDPREDFSQALGRNIGLRRLDRTGGERPQTLAAELGNVQADEPVTTPGAEDPLDAFGGEGPANTDPVTREGLVPASTRLGLDAASDPEAVNAKRIVGGESANPITNRNFLEDSSGNITGIEAETASGSGANRSSAWIRAHGPKGARGLRRAADGTGGGTMSVVDMSQARAERVKIQKLLDEGEKVSARNIYNSQRRKLLGKVRNGTAEEKAAASKALQSLELGQAAREKSLSDKEVATIKADALKSAAATAAGGKVGKKYETAVNDLFSGDGAAPARIQMALDGEPVSEAAVESFLRTNLATLLQGIMPFADDIPDSNNKESFWRQLQYDSRFILGDEIQVRGGGGAFESDFDEENFTKRMLQEYKIDRHNSHRMWEYMHRRLMQFDTE